ncbi:MAG: hypothetical protein HQ515_18590 [Phycisphaeraceae bacterium]|nr:hypothetical protein [Phycisphaeraceae bacterium]
MRTLTIVLVTCLLMTFQIGSTAGAESTVPSKEVLRVFFIGNSHTGCNNLMRVIEKLAIKNEAGIDIVTAGHLVGGCTLERHWNERRALTKMMAGKWDVVVLQENGQGPMAYPDKMRQYARLFDEKIKQAGAKNVLFMTAAYQDRPDTTKAIVKAHLEISKELDADVAPVGIAFEKALTKRPDLTLHNLPDTIHANQRGTYLTACVIWATLTGEKPYGLSGDGLAELTDKERVFLQEMAWESIIECKAKRRIAE